MNKIQLSAAVAMLATGTVFAQSFTSPVYPTQPTSACVQSWRDQDGYLKSCRARRSEVTDAYGRVYACRPGATLVVLTQPVTYCPEPAIL